MSDNTVKTRDGTGDASGGGGGEESPVVTEFLQLMGLSDGGEDGGAVTMHAAPGGGPPGGGPPTGQATEVAPDQGGLDDEKLALKERFQKGYQKDPAHANAARRETLEKLRTQFSNTIGGKATRHGLDTAAGLLTLMDAEVGGVEADLERNAGIKAKLKADLADDKLGRTPEGTGDDHAKRLDQLRMQFSGQLDGPPTDEQIEGVTEIHGLLVAAHGAAEDDAAKRLEDKKADATKRLESLVKPGATPDDVVKGATAEDTKAAIDKAGLVAGQIKAAGHGSFEEIEIGIVAVGILVETAGKAVESRSGKRDKLLEDAEGVKAPVGTEPAEVQNLDTLRGKVGEAMAATPLTDAAVEAGDKALVALNTEKTRLDGVVLVRQKRRDTLKSELGKVETPAGLPDQVERLRLARGTVDDALKLPLSEDANTKASDALEALKKDVVAVKEELDSLGGLEGVNALCKELGVKPEAYAGLEASLGGRAKMGPLLKAFPPKELGGLCGALGGGDTGAKAVAGMLATFEPAALKTVTTNLGGADKLGELAKAGLDGAGIKTLTETLGGAKTVGTLMGSGGAATPIALAKALGDKPGPMKDFTAAAGLNGKPQAVVELFTRGCKGDPQKFVALTQSLNTDDAKAQMKALTGDGGLGEQPAVLGEMLGAGCGGDPANLLKLGKAFAGAGNKAARDKLAALLKTGGLAPGQQPGTGADPGCLAALLQHGASNPGSFDDKVASFKTLTGAVPPASMKNLVESGLGRQPDAFGHLVGIGCDGSGAQVTALGNKLSNQPSKLALGKLLTDGGLAPSVKKVPGQDDEVVVDPTCLAHLLKSGAKDGGTAAFGAKADSLLNLAKGMNPAQLGNLKGLLADGGLGREPEVFAALVGRGCEGNAGKVNGLTAGLTDGPSRAGLAGLLTEGGLGGRDVDPDVAAKPECLAELFITGCKGNAAGLKTLVTGLSDTQRKELGSVVQAGGLGQNPEVLGNLYRYGCLSNTTNDASAQSPAKLAGFASGLQGSEEKLKGLLDDGGFGDPRFPRALGQVMRDAFNGAHPNDSSRLADMYDAFADDADPDDDQRATNNSAELAKLATMVEAFSTYPGYVSDNVENPGVALNNVLNVVKLPVDRLKTQFYDTLDTHSQAPISPGDAQLSNDYGVGKLTKEELLQNAATLKNWAPGGEGPTNLPNNRWQCDTHHINARHTRNHFNLNGSGLDPTKVTTLFKEGVGSAKVGQMITQSITNLGPGGLPNDTTFYNQNKTWITRHGTAGGGIQVKMGIQHYHDWQRPNGSWVSNDFDMNQWYPKAGSPGTMTILHDDMREMLDAVRP